MKKIIVALCFMLTFKAVQSQTIDTTIKYCVAAKINPVIYNHDFPVVSDTITHLGVGTEYKATDSSYTVYYYLIACKPTRNILFGWVTLTKQECAPYFDDLVIGFLKPLRTRFGMQFKN